LAEALLITATSYKYSSEPRVKPGFDVLTCRPCSLVHKNTNLLVPLILKVWNFMSFRWEKHIISHFFGFFEGASTFFVVEIAIRFAQENLDVKKVLAPSKNPAKKHKIPQF
jgi:hypothetical protein